jgi:hypothetical protein
VNELNGKRLVSDKARDGWASIQIGGDVVEHLPITSCQYRVKIFKYCTVKLVSMTAYADKIRFVVRGDKMKYFHSVIIVQCDCLVRSDDKIFFPQSDLTSLGCIRI